MKKILYVIITLIGLAGVSHSFTTPSTYSPSTADMTLIQNVEPAIDRIFINDPARANTITLALESLSTRFGSDTREYYILRELYVYMTSKIDAQIVTAQVIAEPVVVVAAPSQVTTSNSNFQPYMSYSTETFDAAVDAGLQVVINFRAPRCPTCKAVSEEIIQYQAEIPDGVVVLEADYDTTKDLQELYGVVHQTTFTFFDSNGQFTKNVRLNRGIDQLLEELR